MYVVCLRKTVVGYYTLAVGPVAHAEVAGRVRRNMPDPLPVMVLGRLAVDTSFQRRGIGKWLLRTVQDAEIAGILAILVHAISELVKRFYEGCGFMASPIDPLTVVLRLPKREKS